MTLAVMLTVLSAFAVGTPEQQAAAAAGVESLEAAFQVVNTNTSRLPCPSDGEPYTVQATLVGPREVLASDEPLAVTVYVPSFGFSSYWSFGAAPGYDYAVAMAADGHISLIYDPLGYGSSDKPHGMQMCLGSAADVLHQVVGALRGGDYTLVGRSPLAFDEVVLASHTSGALITQPAAYSYGDIDGLIVTSWADSGFTAYFAQNTAQSSVVCATGGELSDGDSGAPAYAYIPPPDRFVGTYFSDAEEEVIAAAAAAQRRAPCGDFASAGPGNVENQLLLGDVRAPVLLVYGEDDAMWDHPSAGEQHAGRFTGAQSVDLKFVANTGGALALERTGSTALRATVSQWLCATRLASGSACATLAEEATTPTPRTVEGSPGLQELPSTGPPSPAAVGVLPVALSLALGAVVRARR